MSISIIVIINLIWILYSVTEGSREGFYWHYENQSKRVCDFDINPVFHLQRLIVLSIITALIWPFFSIYSPLLTFGLILEFSYFHNGTYYYTRNKLGGKVYEKGWKDESKTFPPFSALMKYERRKMAMLFGIATQIFIYLFLLG